MSNNEKNISGFYYDVQRDNRLLRVTLHANTKPPTNPYETWYAWTDKSVIKEEGDNIKSIDNTKISPEFPSNLGLCTDHEEDEPGTAQTSINNNKDTRYGKTPICTSILAEDFGITISNSWTDFEGGNQLQNMFNGIMKPLGPYASFLGKGLEKLSQGAANFSNDSDSGIGNLSAKLAKWSAYGSKFANARGNLLGRQLIVQGTRFKYWGGTNVDFGNLAMRFTLFADYVKEGDVYVWKTPDDQLASILPYALGKYVKLVDDKETDPISIKLKEILDKKLGTNDSGELNSEVANNFFGWQIPPAGFAPNIKDLDEIQSGTLMLKFGAYYKLKNLAIQNLQLNYSKQIAKYFNPNTKKIETCPLFCEVTITLVPVTKYSDNKLREFILNRSRTIYDITSHVEKSEGEVLTDDKGNSVKDEDGKEIRINTKSVKITSVTPKVDPTTSITELEKSINNSLGL